MPGSAISPAPPRTTTLTPYTALRHLVSTAPLCVPPSTSVRETLQMLDAARTDAVVVVDEASRVPLGIVTLRDVLRRIAIESGDLEAPVAVVMTGGLITLSADATAHQASVVMVRRGVRHLVLTEADGSYFNVVSQADLYALPGARATELVAAILAARDIPALAALAAKVRAFAKGLLAERVGAEAICQRISALNDLLTLQVIELTAGRFELPYVPWCWLVFGSEGRLEQTLATDQDNGLIFAAASAEEAATLRTAFLPFARAVNEALDACGFPLCKGGIMAGNPKWCLSLPEWRARFADWIGHPQPKALLNAAIFFDFRPLYGDDSLSESLRNWLLDETRNAQLFLRLMAENALQCAPPLGLIRDFVFDDNKDYPNTLDLKMYGSRPFVDAARLLSLTHGVRQTSTAQRLLGAAEAVNFGGDDVAAMVDGFYYIQLLRLRHQHQVLGQEGGGNRINPDELNELDRHILKEAFKQARKLQSRLRLDYRL